MTTYDTIEGWIRDENEGHDSVEDQVDAAYWFWDRNITIPKDRVARTSQVDEHIAHRLDHQIRTSLDNLEDIGVLAQLDPPGSGQYIRHHRTETNFYDPSTRDFVPLLEEDMSRFLDDLANRTEQELQIADGGEDGDDIPETLRDVAAEALDVDAQNVEKTLTNPSDPVVRMNRYDSVVNAIKENERVSRNRNYDEMGWRNSALRWSLSERAAHIEANHSLPS
ncbi:hypothetical protein ACFQL1_11190 [Halomicroarcula sp. GCM10025709]|uniref:hypothetical protein n=1 Tax=Haloarcula TaxID=2237 RepID=UPI0024C382ED|nr:hypothetical protein [Halomicroarcula sp. YJ-61-S]